MELKCPNNTAASAVCVSPECSEHAFDCQRRSCCPHSPHSACKKVKTDSFVFTFEGGFERLARVCTSVSTFYQEFIKEVTKDALVFAEWSTKKLEVKRKFIASTKENQLIRGRDAGLLIKDTEKFSHEYEENIEAYILHWQQLLKNDLNGIKEELYENQMKTTRERNSGRASSSLYSIALNTTIDCREEQKDTLLELLSEEKRVKELRKLFTASEHDFSVKKFHEICDMKFNTLVLIKNSKERIYGGFSPCAWDSNISGEYKADPQHHSFVFNLSNGSKYILAEEKYAIECHALFGPIFGRGGMLMIENQANLNPTYWEELPLTYLPVGEKVWTKDLYRDFVGAEQGERFTLKEWEVFFT